MSRNIICVLFMLFLVSMSGCKDVMDKMGETQYFEDGVWDLTYMDQSLWVDSTKPESEPEGENKP